MEERAGWILLILAFVLLVAQTGAATEYAPSTCIIQRSTIQGHDIVYYETINCKIDKISYDDESTVYVSGLGYIFTSWNGLPSSVGSISLTIKMRCRSLVYNDCKKLLGCEGIDGEEVNYKKYYLELISDCTSDLGFLNPDTQIIVSNGVNSKEIATVAVTNDYSYYTYDLTNILKPASGYYSVTINNNKKYVTGSGSRYVFKTIYIDLVKLEAEPCQCSSGICCDGCNYKPSGTACGASTCPSDYYYQNSGNCYKADYPESCTKTCDSSGNCQDCCNPVISLNNWSCNPLCQKPDYTSSCTGQTPPKCINLPSTTTCGTNICSSNNGYVQSSGNCYYRVYNDCTKYCSNGICQDCACTYTDYPQSWDCGICKEKDYSSCALTTGPLCKNSAPGTPCTISGQQGKCDGYGNCTVPPSLSVSATLSSSSIKAGETTMLKGEIICSNANCGYVYVHAKNTSGSPINQIPGLSVQGTNPYTCGYMGSGQKCYPNWTITGMSAGTYPLYLIATNGTLINTSSIVTLNVTEIPSGSLSISGLTPVTTTVGIPVTISANILCSGISGSYCGNVTSYLYYNSSSSSWVLMGPSGSLYTTSNNPQRPTSCSNLWSGQSCPVYWTVNSTKTGTYHINMVADSDSPKVDNSSHSVQLVVKEKPVGVISIESLGLNPAQIKTGEETNLSAVIKCLSSDSITTVSCGKVNAYTRHNGTKIEVSGPLATQIPERECGTMGSGGTCNVIWSIKGNSVGTYLVDILAYSDSAEVQDKTSETKTLSVIKNIGTLSIPRLYATPPEINITNTTTISVTVNCSTSYCGNINLTLSVPSGLVFEGASQQYCLSFPCNLNFTLRGISEGSFTVSLEAKSNESIPTATNSTSIVVKGPNPLLSLTITIPNSATLFEPVQAKTTVYCHVKNCGNTKTAIAYKTTEGWKEISYSGDVHISNQQQNPISTEMFVNQSKEIVWELNFTKTGIYEIMVYANGSDPGVVNATYITLINASPVSRISIEILSPNDGETFSLGETVFLKSRITKGGNPLIGIKPFVSLSSFLGAELFDDGKHNDSLNDDGIYGGEIKLLLEGIRERKPQYLAFRAGDSEEKIYIYIDPSLSVTLKTDKYSYEWGENITIYGEVKRKDKETSSDIQAYLECGGWTGQANSFSSENGSYLINYQNIYMPPFSDCNLSIQILAKDNYENFGNAIKEVLVKAYKGDLYSLSFSMERYNYSRMENIPIRATVSYLGSTQTNANVKCSFLGKEITLTEKNGEYIGYYEIPFDAPLKEETLSCSASGPKSEKPGPGSTKIKIEPVPIQLSIVSPKLLPNNIIYVFSENMVALVVNATYPDKKPVLGAEIHITINNQTVKLKHMGNGTYTTDEGWFTGSGVTEMFLSAQDAYGNNGNNNITLVVNPSQFNWWWLLLIPAGLAILFFLWYYVKSKEQPKVQIQEKIIRLPVTERVREIVYKPIRVPSQQKIDPITKLRREIAELEERSNTVNRAKDIAEQQYYKRQIDEQTFNNLMQRYEEKLIEIDAAIREKRKKLREMGAV
ncbi:MAG: hypothetical protein QXN71_00250 [Candidatus Aenigmatarchaeota archaeon]